MTVSIYKDKAELNAKIAKVLKGASAMKAAIHECLVNAQIVLVDGGDVRPLNALFQGTKDVCHKNTVATWINNNCSVKWDNEVKAFAHSKKRVASFLSDDEGAAATKELLASEPYHMLAKPDNPFKGFELSRKVAALIHQSQLVADGFHPTKKDADKQPVPLTDEEKATSIDVDMLPSLVKLAA